MDSGEPKEPLLDGGPDLSCERAILKGEGAAHCKVWGLQCAVSCARKAEPIEMPFGMLSLVGLGNHVLDACVRSNFFCERVVNVWNSLPDVSFESFYRFRCSIMRINLSSHLRYCGRIS